MGVHLGVREHEKLLCSHEIPYVDIVWFLACCIVYVPVASRPLACWGQRGLGM